MPDTTIEKLELLRCMFIEHATDVSADEKTFFHNTANSIIADVEDLQKRNEALHMRARMYMIATDTVCEM